MFKVKDKQGNGYTAYAVREKDGLTLLLMYFGFWCWQDASQFEPTE